MWEYILGGIVCFVGGLIIGWLIGLGNGIDYVLKKMSFEQLLEIN